MKYAGYWLEVKYWLCFDMQWKSLVVSSHKIASRPHSASARMRSVIFTLAVTHASH